MHCTAAPRLEATVPDRESGYALEGTLAHAYCAMKLKSFLKQDTAAEEKEIAGLYENYHTGEMDEYTDVYKIIVLEKLTAARTATRDARLLVGSAADVAALVRTPITLRTVDKATNPLITGLDDNQSICT